MQFEERKQELRQYLVFRVKLIEFLDTAALWMQLTNGRVRPTPAQRKPSDFADSLRTSLLGWLALFVDKNGMNVIELWKKLFPNRREEIEQSWQRIKPAWDILRRSRDKAAFHADKPRAFFDARRKIQQNGNMIMQALKEFQKLQQAILNAESAELADFPAAVNIFLDELEAAGHRYNRAEFKRYLLIPDCKSSL